MTESPIKPRDPAELQPFSMRSRCPKCLGSIHDFRWRRWDQCSDECRMDVAYLAEELPKEEGGHLHVMCRDCGFQWAMITAERAGRDSDRQ